MRFALSAGTLAVGAETPTSRTAGAVSGSLGDGAALAEGDVSVPARLLASSPLAYPSGARQAEIEVDLPVEIVVEPSGSVSAARGLAHVGYGLDEAALHAIRGYRFSPALRDGHPVRVRMRWTVQFRLQ